VELEAYLDVIVDDLKQRSRDGCNAVDDFTKGGVAEGGRNAARVNSTHRVVRPVLRITFDGTLHGNTTVENDVDKRRDVENVGDRSKGGVLSKGVTSEGTISLNETFHAHILERCLLGDDESDLSELSGEKEAIGMAESIFGGANINVGEEREGLDMAILVRGVVGHVHIPLADSLALDTTEMDGLLLRVVLDDLDDRKSVDGEQMGVGTFPNGTGSRRAVVQIHTHTRLLRSLASEDIDSGGLGNLGRPSENLLASAVGCLDANYNIAVAHADVAELDFEVVAWNDHSNEVDVVTVKECQLEARTYPEKKHTQ
jgi:hypothetical protein